MQGADSCLAAGRLRDRGSKACTSDRFNLRDDGYSPVFMANIKSRYGSCVSHGHQSRNGTG